MTLQHPDTVTFYDCEIMRLAGEKYAMEPMDALRRFVRSETHEMVRDASFGLTSFGAPGVFDIWEAELVTGDPRNSIYIRGE